MVFQKKINDSFTVFLTDIALVHFAALHEVKAMDDLYISDIKQLSHPLSELGTPSVKIWQLMTQALGAVKTSNLPILLHLSKQLVLHVSETQTAEQGGQAGALGDALALDIAPGDGSGG